MSRRTEQLSANIVRICAAKLVEFPVPGTLLTVTRAKVAPDNRRATIWVAGWIDVSDSLKNKLRLELQSALAHKSTTKFTPLLEIIDDQTAANAAAIVDLVKSSLEKDRPQ